MESVVGIVLEAVCREFVWSSICMCSFSKKKSSYTA